jgi:predicted metal-dependent hydrolase
VSDPTTRPGTTGPGASARPGTAARPGTILQRGRAKAYRPLPPERRREILADGLAAYDRGDFFLAHELLEPAWMGASDPAERDLYQGLIKLAAAFVHQARGNPAGVAKNLRGARDLLAAGATMGREEGLDIEAVVRDIDLALTGNPGTRPSAIPIPRVSG